jgi:DUF4097 and DUF4098 domain-containing protein YvlB
MARTIALLLCLVPALPGARIEEKQIIKKTFSQAAQIEVDNVNGAVTVKGSDVREIRLRANETISAETKEQIEQARSEVRLDTTESGNKLRVYADGPFRGRHSGRRDYEVRCDIEIEAPRESAISLRTVNGSIHVDGISAGFDAKTINGRVDLENMAAAGRAYSLNGGVKATFRANPREESYFGALNGQVELYFQPGLSADVSVKTMHGDVSTDFPFTMLPAAAASVERRGGRNVYRSNRSTNIRIGSGGPAVKLETLNGNIRILLWEGVK